MDIKKDIKKRMDSLEKIAQILRDAVEEKRTFIVLVDNGDGTYEKIQLGRDTEALSMAITFIDQQVGDDPTGL